MTTRIKPEFKRVIREHSAVYVKKLEGGAEVQRERDGPFSAISSAGRFLGWTPIQEHAEFMAVNGYCNNFGMHEVLSDLSLWVAWNDALNSGVRPLESEDGTQFISLGYGVVMTAKKCDDSWDVALITDREVWDRYGDDQHECLLLRPAAHPFVLE